MIWIYFAVTMWCIVPYYDNAPAWQNHTPRSCWEMWVFLFDFHVHQNELEVSVFNWFNFRSMQILEAKHPKVNTWCWRLSLSYHNAWHCAFVPHLIRCCLSTQNAGCVLDYELLNGWFSNFVSLVTLPRNYVLALISNHCCSDEHTLIQCTRARTILPLEKWVP